MMKIFKCQLKMFLPGIFYFHSSDIEEKYVIIEVDNQLVEKVTIDTKP